MHGTLYVVASPIGNLEDISLRSLEVLKKADLILCEDTRTSQTLLAHYAIERPTKSFHQHNEASQCNTIIKQLLEGKDIALLSDAGTPLIRDPGKMLVAEAHRAGISVVPLPGASAIVTALSACAFGGDCFVFNGFLPAKRSQRLKHLTKLLCDKRTQVFFEAPHRLLECLEDIEEVFGKERPICLAKELTKIHEALVHGTADEVGAWLREKQGRIKGEFVIIVEGSQGGQEDDVHISLASLLATLAEHLAPSQAAKIAAHLTERSRRELYQKDRGEDN